MFAGGRYRVERFLGEGAHKRVYLAHDVTLDREVAFALIGGEGLDAGRADRVRREGVAMGRLAGHPNVVTVYDAGEERGAPYIVEEFLEGGTVADLLAGSPGRRLPVERAVRIAADVCAALEHAHRRGVVHRDLKPSNVWLAADGTAKLGDFGLVAALRQTASGTFARLTSEGMMVGTIPYLAPEQALGRSPDPRADLYSLGAVLYELVTGGPPFAGDDAVAIISQHLRTPPVAPAWRNPEVPGPLDALIVALLAKAPGDRPQSAGEVVGALEALAAPGRRRASTVNGAANPLDRLATGVHVGREQEIDDLCAAADVAMSGRGQLVLISGEPGIGKTRLVEELTTYASLRDALALWGRCYEGGGAPPYWPWIQVIRAYSVDHDPDALAEAMGPGAADIAQIVSEVRRRLPGLEPPPPSSVGDEQARFRLFDAVATFLLNASRREPLVVVLDDLHFADRGSLALLEFLAPQLGRARMLVVATYRDSELHVQRSLVQTLGELARVQRPRRIVLRGLARAAVARYVALTAGVEPDDELVEAIHTKSEGNPFFVAEIVRLLSAEKQLDGAAAEISIPQELRELTARRLAPLSDYCREALAIAAVVGRDFDLRVLQAVTDADAEPLLEALEEAQAARVITSTEPGRYHFAHILISEALVDGLSARRRLRLHRRVGEALERAYAGQLEHRLGELAHHFLEASPAGDAERGIRYAVAAAEHAGGRLAYAESARMYERALRALDFLPTDTARRCDLLLALGEAHHRAGAHRRANDAFRQAASLARELPSPERLARAALGYGGPRGSFGVVDHELVSLLEEALWTLDGHDAVRARVLARLAMEQYFGGAAERRAALVDEAEAIARGLGDPATIAYALNARYAALWGPENATERLEIANEVLELARRASDHRLAREGRGRRIVALLELGDTAGAHSEIDEHARAANELRQPYGRWQAAVWQAAEALSVGRFADGESRAQEALELGRRVRMTDAENCFAVQNFIAAMELGRLAELEHAVEQLAKREPEAMRWITGLAYMHAELGHRKQAASAFDPVAARGFAAIARDNQWLMRIATLADTCAFLGDVAHADALRELLLPYAGRNVVMVEGWACLGSAARPLAVLSATIGRWDEAEAQFQAAIDFNSRLGARPWLARTEFGYAQMLVARRCQGDTERAHDLLEKALATARGLGMTTLAERAATQLAATSS
ncbi:MAG TPA: AAA family ATPase [Solirubrobacteraceae bacterium]|nr:AAA family ATPase [Solirubrobacteraceae bacterium]